jgi:hypothetical protein
VSIVVTVSATTDVEPDEAFRRLADYESYAEHTSTVRSVEIVQVAGEPHSVWEVDFRGGVLCWTERDHTDAAARTLRFSQTDGDLELFDGGWDVVPEAGGARVTFSAVLDLGIPSLAPIVDPVAEQALRQNICTILRGLFAGDRLDLTTGAAGGGRGAGGSSALAGVAPA